MFSLRLGIVLVGLCCTVLCEERPKCSTFESCAKGYGKTIHVSVVPNDPKKITVEIQNDIYNDLCRSKDVLPHCASSFKECFDGGSFFEGKEEDFKKVMDLTCSNKPKYMATYKCGLKLNEKGHQNYFRKYMVSEKCLALQAKYNQAAANRKGSSEYCSLLTEWIDCVPQMREQQTCLAPFYVFLHESGIAVDCYSFYQSLSSAGVVPEVSLFYYAFVSLVVFMFWR